jgi:hypothetical protein
VISLIVAPGECIAGFDSGTAIAAHAVPAVRPVGPTALVASAVWSFPNAVAEEQAPRDRTEGRVLRLQLWERLTRLRKLGLVVFAGRNRGPLFPTRALLRIPTNFWMPCCQVFATHGARKISISSPRAWPPVAVSGSTGLRGQRR